MNTFLPYADFLESASCLDRQRLGKQRVEAWQIYLTLQRIKARTLRISAFERDYVGKSIGNLQEYDSLLKEKIAWENHPAVRMWSGFEPALLSYGMACCEQWISRGYKDTLLPKFIQEFKRVCPSYKFDLPRFFGNKEFHASHRSNLLRKDPVHYGKFGWKEPPTLEYVWVIS